MGGLTQSTAPSVEPVTVSEFKTYARVDGTDDDVLIESLVEAARDYAEEYQSRQLITATWTQTFDAFPDEEILLARSPAQSVSSITYVDTAGTSQTWSSDYYDVETSGEVGRVQPAYGEVFPTTRDQMEAVTVTFVAGYGDATTDVPESTKTAIKILALHWYESREPVITGVTVTNVPMSVNLLLDKERVWNVE